MINQTESKPVAEFLNDYAMIAPKMYSKTGNASNEFESIYTVVALFDSRTQARDAILKMQHQGLHSSQIVSISKHYQEHEDAMNWEYVSQDNYLRHDLIGLGIDVGDTSCLESAVDQGQFLVVAIITDRPSTQAQRLLESIGQRNNCLEMTYSN